MPTPPYSVTKKQLVDDLREIFSLLGQAETIFLALPLRVSYEAIVTLEQACKS